MKGQIHGLTRKEAKLPAILLLLGIAMVASCGKGQDSVMSTAENSSNPQQKSPQQATPAIQPPAETAPAPAAQPSGMAGMAGMAGAGGKMAGPNMTADGLPRGKMMEGERSPAKPMITPNPDPFPARPTPQVVMENGKIVQPWQAPAEALALENPVKNDPNAVAIGKGLYAQKCADCHGKEGKGNGWMSKQILRPPTNLASKVVQANTDGELFWKITNGKSPMPSTRVRFTDQERWYIVSYIRTFKP